MRRPRVLKEAALSVDDIVQFTRAFTIQVVTHAAYAMSPDPEDNFLFDIALQYKAAVMITDEKALLNFAASPVAIRSLKWFKENFPLP